MVCDPAVYLDNDLIDICGGGGSSAPHQRTTWVTLKVQYDLGELCGHLQRANPELAGQAHSPPEEPLIPFPLPSLLGGFPPCLLAVRITSDVN